MEKEGKLVEINNNYKDVEIDGVDYQLSSNQYIRSNEKYFL